MEVILTILSYSALPATYIAITVFLGWYSVWLGKKYGQEELDEAEDTTDTDFRKEREIWRREGFENWDEEYQRLQREALVERTGLTDHELTDYVGILQRFFWAMQAIEGSSKSGVPHDPHAYEVSRLRNGYGEVVMTNYSNDCECFACMKEKYADLARQLADKAKPFEELIRLKVNPDFDGIASFSKDGYHPDFDKGPSELLSSYQEIYRKR